MFKLFESWQLETTQLFTLEKFNNKEFFMFIVTILFMYAMTEALRLVVDGIISNHLLANVELSLIFSVAQVAVVTLLVFLSKFGSQCVRLSRL